MRKSYSAAFKAKVAFGGGERGSELGGAVVAV